jgi:hypothetical protein
LIWSGWDSEVDQGWAAGVRMATLAAPSAIQLFFLSLVWRAAASSRPEMALVELEPELLEDLRVRVLTKTPGNVWDYPLVLHQLVTKGFAHNRAPLLEFEPSPPLRNGKSSMMRRVRIYIDGLVGQVHLPGQAQVNEEFLRSCAVGGGDPQTMIFTHTFEKSRAYANVVDDGALIWLNFELRNQVGEAGPLGSRFGYLSPKALRFG